MRKKKRNKRDQKGRSIIMLRNVERKLKRIRINNQIMTQVRKKEKSNSGESIEDMSMNKKNQSKNLERNL